MHKEPAGFFSLSCSGGFRGSEPRRCKLEELGSCLKAATLFHVVVKSFVVIDVQATDKHMARNAYDPAWISVDDDDCAQPRCKSDMSGCVASIPEALHDRFLGFGFVLTL